MHTDPQRPSMTPQKPYAPTITTWVHDYALPFGAYMLANHSSEKDLTVVITKTNGLWVKDAQGKGIALDLCRHLNSDTELFAPLSNHQKMSIQHIQQGFVDGIQDLCTWIDTLNTAERTRLVVNLYTYPDSKTTTCRLVIQEPCNVVSGHNLERDDKVHTFELAMDSSLRDAFDSPQPSRARVSWFSRMFEACARFTR